MKNRRAGACSAGGSKENDTVAPQGRGWPASILIQKAKFGEEDALGDLSRCDRVNRGAAQALLNSEGIGGVNHTATSTSRSRHPHAPDHVGNDQPPIQVS